MKRTVTVICAKCSKTKKMYGIRTEKMNGSWFFTWAFPLEKSVADKEKYSETVINDAPSNSENYNGCPYCTSKNLIYCSNCGKLNCDNGEEMFICGWCGLSGTVSHDGWGTLSGGGF